MNSPIQTHPNHITNNLMVLGLCQGFSVLVLGFLKVWVNLERCIDQNENKKK